MLKPNFSYITKEWLYKRLSDTSVTSHIQNIQKTWTTRGTSHYDYRAEHQSQYPKYCATGSSSTSVKPAAKASVSARL